MTAWRFDPSRYEGRTEGEWRAGRPDMISLDLDGDGYAKSVYVDDPRGGFHRVTGTKLPLEVCRGLAPEVEEAHANARLIADAPHLLAEVVRLRELVKWEAEMALLIMEHIARVLDSSNDDKAKIARCCIRDIVNEKRAALSQEGSDGE